MRTHHFPVQNDPLSPNVIFFEKNNSNKLYAPLGSLHCAKFSKNH